MHGMGMVYYFTMTTPDVNLPKNWKLNFQDDINWQGWVSHVDNMNTVHPINNTEDTLW